MTFKTSKHWRPHRLQSAQGISSAIKSAYEPKQAATVAVFQGEAILMGKRRDSLLWSLPGGHIQQNETPYQGAVRELHEETGLRPDELTSIGQSMTAEGVLVYAFKYELTTTREGARDITTKYDPDQEFLELRWVHIGSHEWEEIKSKLHHPDNVGLRLLRLL